ncbi:MAG: hypothetical protein K2F78_01995 [Muribaculaceae bacterium]|nr:hypothetical protein [Muribaculaceae bacterium]
MRLNKLLTAILGGAFLLGSAACTDEVEYTPAPVYDGDEVFFSNELPSTINIPSLTATSVDVPIMRLRAADELTVGLTGSVTFPDGTDASSIFEVPTEVTFAADATTAEIPIAIISKVENDVNYVLNLAIVSDQASPYGPTEVTVNLLYSPWTDLEPYSTTEYEGVMGAPWTGEPIGGVVYTAHSLINDYDEEWVFPGPRYSNLYFDYDLYVDKRNVMTIDGETVYRVTMPLTDTHYDNGEDRIMYIDAFTWMRLYGAENGASLSDAQINNIMANNGFEQSYYNPETGTFRLWLVPCVRGEEIARYGQSYTTLQLPGFVNYAIDFSVLGSFVANGRESLVINATRSNDLASFAYTISAGELTEAQVKAEAEAIAADTDADVYVEQSVNILFPFNQDGKYTLVAVGYDASGAAVYETSYVFNAQTVQAAREWESIGWCEYTDTFIYDMYNGDDTPEDEIIGGETWSVEVEENINTPGLYRLVNPYYFWVADIMGASSNYLSLINITEPTRLLRLGFAGVWV